MQLKIFNLTQLQCNMISEIVSFVWTLYNKDKWFKEFQHANIASIQTVSENGSHLKHRKMNRDVLNAIKYWSHLRWRQLRKRMNKKIIFRQQQDQWVWIIILLHQMTEEQISMVQTKIQIIQTKKIKEAFIDFKSNKFEIQNMYLKL